MSSKATTVAMLGAGVGGAHTALSAFAAAPAAPFYTVTLTRGVAGTGTAAELFLRSPREQRAGSEGAASAFARLAAPALAAATSAAIVAAVAAARRPRAARGGGRGGGRDSGRRGQGARVLRMATATGLENVSFKTAFMFPGQGAQSVGMCQELVDSCPAAAELFKKASEILGYDLLDRCTNGPKEVLDTTAVSQPAIFVASMAAVEKLRQDEGDAAVDQATVAMGLSLGEYSALCFAGALSFEDGVRITKARGEAMQAAADACESAMVSVVGLDREQTEALCKKASEDSGKKVAIANYLCNGNYTVSGDKAACEKLVEIAKPQFKARMAVMLAVAGAFHTDFMAPAVDKLKEALAAADLKAPRIPVVSNVDAQPHGGPEEIRSKLAAQVTSPVMWETQMKDMVAAGFEKGYELGPGKVIAGIMKRIDKDAAGAITNITA